VGIGGPVETPRPRPPANPAATDQTDGPGVRERRFDLRAVADDVPVPEQAVDAGVAEAREGIGVEVREGVAEGVALGEDGPPREPGLEGLQAQPLEQPPLVEHGKPHSSS
jgi:hypothetical protein